MSKIMHIGKREFIQHTSKYLKLAGKDAKTIVITHHNHPELVLNKIEINSIKSLRGSATVQIVGNINDPVFLGFDQW